LIRACLDVNVLVSGFPASSGVPAELIERRLRREFELILSEHILIEAAEAWEQPYWAARYTADQVRNTLELLRERARGVLPATTVHGVGEDEEDDLVLATAISGDASFLVTGDRHLQRLGRYEKTLILSPRQFLEILENQAGDAA
jgi:putative PIN family toxin of toxin-antitoxin system